MKLINNCRKKALEKKQLDKIYRRLAKLCKQNEEVPFKRKIKFGSTVH